MTKQLTIPDIEQLLRRAAPDEPPVLPPLVLPTDAEAVRGSVGLRFRGGRLPRLRPAYAVALLLLALGAAVVAVGALRLFEPDDPLASVCYRDPAQPESPECLSLPLPVGWTMLGSGQLQVDRYTEDGLAVDFVEQVMASAPLDPCATPAGPPAPVPSGSDPFGGPMPTPEGGLDCVLSATLPDNGIRIVAMYATRIRAAEDGSQPLDLSEPTEEAGWTEEVAGRPARLTVTTREDGDRAVETWTWDILRPGRIELVLRVRAEIAGPDLEAGRKAVQAVIGTVGFEEVVPDIDPSKANEALGTTLDTLDREARGRRSDFYACFPREPGVAPGTIVGGPAGPIAAALEVTCRSEVSASRAGVFRIVLEVGWGKTPEGDADTLRAEFFTTGSLDKGWLSYLGPVMTSLAGRPMPDAGAEGWFPNSGYELPAPLTGPLNLPAGSFVMMLWPGEGSLPAPGGADDSIYPTVVGTHLYVLEGPEIVDGEEWYRVEHEGEGYLGVGWIRGTRDGRPQLRPIEPACPPGDVSVGDVAWLTAAERLHCFGDREVRLEGVLVALEDRGPVMCSSGDGELTPCPGFPGEPSWLTAAAAWNLFGAGGEDGPEPPVEVWLDPSLGAPAAGAVLRVRGHFDDAAAAACQGPDEEGAFDDSIVDRFACRERFVITAIEAS